jgi:glutamine amidotransferase
MGNLRSVAKALEAAGAAVTVSPDPAELARADALCVPGQGIFGVCMDNLARDGLGDLVQTWIAEGRPYLGICLGMQVLFDSSDERGPRPGLGILPGRVTRIAARVPVPHIGWNVVGDDYFYFDHSYAVHPDDDSIVEGWCEHGERFAAIVRSGPVLGVQFHPEKSSTGGIALLERWVAAA